MSTITISFCKLGLGPTVVFTVRSSYLVSKRFYANTVSWIVKKTLM